MIPTELMHSLCQGEHQDYRYHLPAPHAGSPTGEGKGVMNLFPFGFAVYCGRYLQGQGKPLGNGLNPHLKGKHFWGNSWFSIIS